MSQHELGILSWRTTNNEPNELNEHVQFLDEIGKRKKQPAFSDLTITPKENDQIDLEGQYDSNGKLYCFKFLRRLKGLYTWKVPWIAVLLSAVQVAVYSVACNDSIALLMFKPQRKRDLWRFITYQLIHFNQTHLLLNVALQILIAYPLESSEGHFRTLVVYSSGVVFGAIGTSYIFDKDRSIVGSSAGVYSLLFSHLSQIILNWAVISHRILRLMAVSMLFSCDILFSIFRDLYWNNLEPKISLSAHLNGGLAGLFTGLAIFRRNLNRTTNNKTFLE